MESASIKARAFKSSGFVSEAPVNANPQEDHFFLSSAAAADDFSIDQFFEFHGLSEDEEEDEEDKKSSSLHDRVHEGSSFSVIDFCGSFSVADGLSIPAEDMEELELWSHLMDGTFHHDIFACPATYPDVIPAPNRVHFEPKSRPVLTRPRTKHPRSISGSWATFSLIESQYSEPDRVQLTGPGLSGSRKTGMKRKSPATEDGDSAYGPAQQRKCTHCQVQKTPQWRTGPLGPKTLCNACGVRFNMGRLFPEYRPACSPTFSSEIHSNNHRKVAEMREEDIWADRIRFSSRNSELLKESSEPVWVGKQGYYLE